MKNTMTRYAALAFIVLATGFLVYAKRGTPSAADGAAGHPASVAVAAPEAEETVLVMSPLPDFTEGLLHLCGGGKYSPALRSVRSEQLQRIAAKWLEGLARYAWIALPCLETRMGTHKTMLSHAGARGIVQLMPATAKAEAVRCGLGEVRDEDLMDAELNMNISACHFADLVEKHGLELAPCMYNGGSASETCKLAKQFIPGGPKETLGYAAIHSMIMFRFLTDSTKTTPPRKVATTHKEEVK